MVKFSIADKFIPFLFCRNIICCIIKIKLKIAKHKNRTKMMYLYMYKILPNTDFLLFIRLLVLLRISLGLGPWSRLQPGYGSTKLMWIRNTVETIHKFVITFMIQIEQLTTHFKTDRSSSNSFSNIRAIKGALMMKKKALHQESH